MRSMLCPHWGARPGFQNKAVQETVHSYLSTFDAYRKNNPPQCSTKLQWSGWRESRRNKHSRNISFSGRAVSQRNTWFFALLSALLQCMHTPSTPGEGSSPIVLRAFCYSYHAITTQHSCSHWFHFLTIITSCVKENPFNRESVLFNRKGWFYTKYCGEV